MPENMPQNPETQEDLLEKLLAGAAQREARKATEELAKKGTVTKAEFSSALSEFEQNLIEKIDSVLSDKLQKAAPIPEPAAADPTDEEPVQKAGGRRSTVQGASDPRQDNPVRYLIQKGRKGDQYDDLDKALIWELTKKGFTQGMSSQEIDGTDFADDQYPN